MPIVTNYTGVVAGHLGFANSRYYADGRPFMVTFSFETDTSGIAINFTGALASSFVALTDAQKAVVRAAIDIWDDACGITFVEVPAGMGDVKIGTYNIGLIGGLPPGSRAAAATDAIYIDLNYTDMDKLFGDMLQQVGFTLGLKRPNDGTNRLSTDLDNWQFTVMSQNSGGITRTGLGALDREAVLKLYGPEGAIDPALSLYQWSPDTLTLTQTGTEGDDVIEGIYANDVINGLGGRDSISGGAGNNTIYGGADSDNIFVQARNGNSVLDGGDGGDTFQIGAYSNSSVAITGGNGSDVVSYLYQLGTEGLSLAFDGGDGTDRLNLTIGSLFGPAEKVLDVNVLTNRGTTLNSVEIVILITNSFNQVEKLSLYGSKLSEFFTSSQSVKTNVMFGRGGSDSFSPSATSSRIDGGAGTDIAQFSGNRASYTVQAVGLGLRITDSNTSTSGNGTDVYSNVETFRFADGEVSLSAMNDAVLPSTNDWRLFMNDGAAVTIGGAGTVYGTAASQDVTVTERRGVINLDPSFNKGGDVLRLFDPASDWQVSRNGATVQLTNAGGETVINIPVGPAGMIVAFADGVRTLKIDTSASALVIGSQVITSTVSTVSAASEGPVPATSALTGTSKMFVGEMRYADVGGNVSIFGTTDVEDLFLSGGMIVLDPSFNKGFDTLHFSAAASTFTATTSGAAIRLRGDGIDVTIPVGTAGLVLDFGQSDQRELYLDPQTFGIYINDQQISAGGTSLTAFG